MFRSDKDREYILEILAHLVERFRWFCHAYCLMDNHYHLVIEAWEANLARGMRQLNGAYTQRYNGSTGDRDTSSREECC
ncbi:MAG: transposase [Syntrophorhabdales bacterium]